MEYFYQICLTFADFDMDPDSITQEIGISPDFTQIKGDEVISKINIKRIARRSLWMLYSKPKDMHADIDYHFDYLRNKFEGREEKIKDLCANIRTNLTVIINDEGKDFRSIELNRWFVDFSSYCGLSIRIDYYGN